MRCAGTMTPQGTRCYFDATPGINHCPGHLQDPDRWSAGDHAKPPKIRRKRPKMTSPEIIPKMGQS